MTMVRDDDDDRDEVGLEMLRTTMDDADTDAGRDHDRDRVHDDDEA